MIEKSIDRNPAQPGIKTRLAAEAAERLIGLQPNLLRQVLRLMRVARVIQRQGIYAPLIRPSQRTESVVIAFLRTLDQFVFMDHRLSSFSEVAHIDTKPILWLARKRKFFLPRGPRL